MPFEIFSYVVAKRAGSLDLREIRYCKKICKKDGIKTITLGLLSLYQAIIIVFLRFAFSFVPD